MRETLPKESDPLCYGHKWSVRRFVGVGVGVYTCTWRPEVNFGVIPEEPPTLLFLRQSLASLELAK